MKQSRVLGVFLVTVVLLASVLPGLAQSPAGMRLYAFSSGALTVPKSLLQAGAPGTPTPVPVGFFVIQHPKGNVLFDTGNNDRIINDPSYWGAFVQGLNPVRTPDVAIDAQLAKIGLKPDDIKFVVVGHMHLDHGGNIGKFPKSTLVVQKDEVRNAFWPEPGTAGPYIPGDFMMLRSDPGTSPLPNKWPMIQLEGDLDLFNDNSVVVKRWVGHTPGSQMMIVRLPKSGTTILTSDNVYFADNVTKNLLPDVSLAYSPSGILNAYQWIREMQARENAKFYTAHDPDAWKAMKHAPDYLE
jgi:glyoxylase-like metal-dependent hydrolase (beta-lactamase superfamily II)